MNKPLLTILSLTCALFLANCTNNISGGVENGNPLLAGTVRDVKGNATSGAIIRVVPHDNNPQHGPTISAATVSDENGHYEIDDIDDGQYNVIGETPDASLSFIESVTIENDKNKTYENIITTPGNFTGVVKLHPYRQGMVLIIILGTNYYTMTSDTVGNFTTPNIPEGTYRVMVISSLPEFADTLFTVDVKSGKTTTLDTIELEYSGVSFDSAAMALFNDSKANLPGTYTGIASYPTIGSWSICFKIDSDGHYSAYNTTTKDYAALHVGSDTDHPDKKINLISINADGDINGEIQIYNNSLPYEEIRTDQFTDFRFDPEFDSCSFKMDYLSVKLHRVSPDELPDLPVLSPEIHIEGNFIPVYYTDEVTISLEAVSDEADTIIYQIIEQDISEVQHWGSIFGADEYWNDDISYETYSEPITLNKKGQPFLVLARIHSGLRKSGVRGHWLQIR